MLFDLFITEFCAEFECFSLAATRINLIQSVASSNASHWISQRCAVTVSLLSIINKSCPPCSLRQTNGVANAEFTLHNFSPIFHSPTGFDKLLTNARDRRQIGAQSHSVNYQRCDLRESLTPAKYLACYISGAVCDSQSRCVQ